MPVDEPEILTYQIKMEKSRIVMLIEDSKLREFVETMSNNVKPANSEHMRKLKDEIMSLLDKCNDLNVISQKWREAPKAHITEDGQDRIEHYINVTMERLETWLPNNWAALVNELRSEMKVAYEKFVNLRKKYPKLFEISSGIQGSELIKAYIARDIQDYVMYGINLSLRCLPYPELREYWVEKIAKHFEMLYRQLEGLNVRNEDDVRRLAEDVSLYKQYMLDLADQYDMDSGWSQFNSKAYLVLRQKGEVPFSDLIERDKGGIRAFYSCVVRKIGPLTIRYYNRKKPFEISQRN